MSGHAVSEKPSLSSKRPPSAEVKRRNLPAKTTKVRNVKPVKSQPTVTAVNTGANLPTLYNVVTVSTAGGSKLLTQNNPLSYSPEYYQNALAELKLGLKIIGIFLFLVYLGWAAAIQTNTTGSGDLIYNSGLIGGSLMLVALMYSVIKRVKAIRRYLTSEMWYYLHIGCGAIGAYLVLLHSSFDLRSINASIGLVTTLVVIASGALGRYLYTLLTISLHRQLVAVKKTEQNLFEITSRYERDRSFFMRERLARFTLHCFRKPQSRLKYVAQWISIVCFGLYSYFGSSSDLRKIAKNMSKVTRLNKKDIVILKKYQRKMLRQFVIHTAKMGYTSLVEQVLRHWRIFHIPALYLLTITATAHVIVVHMY